MEVVDRDGWLTVADVAQELGISEYTVRRWAKLGSLPAYVLPGGWLRFRRDEIQPKPRQGSA